MAAAPSPQAAVALGGKWHYAFPDGSGIETGGHARQFNDPSVTWAIERLGGIAGFNIVELGPLEAAHTYMLDRAGAKSIIAIEALKSGYLKCLIAKEVLGIKSAQFLHGNFIPWLENEERQFDLIWASGVLYHMTEPLKLLELIARRTDKVYIWTHFYPDDAVPSYVRTRYVQWQGKTVPQFDRPYFMLRPRHFRGGVYSGRAWLRRSDVLDALKTLGFVRIDITHEDYGNRLGPSFAVLARKAQ